MFEVIVTLHDDDTGKWVIRASDRDGERAVMLAETDDQEQADNIIATIAKESSAQRTSGVSKRRPSRARA